MKGNLRKRKSRGHLTRDDLVDEEESVVRSEELKRGGADEEEVEELEDEGELEEEEVEGPSDEG